MRYEKKSILSQVELATKSQKPFLEISEEQAENFKTIVAYTLGVIGATGVVALAIVAPKVLVGLSKIHKSLKGRRKTFKEKQETVERTFYYLKRHGLVKISSGKGSTLLELTQKGLEKLKIVKALSTSVKRPKKWDGHWWLVAADIPTKEYRWAADLFRKKIKEMRFFPLQRTLWFYPYNPAKEIEFLANHFGIGRFVTVMEVCSLDEDDQKKLKMHFNL